jgi:transposase
MRSDSDDKLLLTLIRQEARRQGLRMRDLASRMRVSEPTVKRWLAGKGVSLKAWTELLAALGLTLQEALEQVRKVTLHQLEYTEKQEKALSRTPGLLAFYQQLLLGRSIQELQAEHRLSERAVREYLRRLDEIDLLRWEKGLGFRLLKKGEPRWRKNGPLARAFRKAALDEFLGKHLDGLKLGIYSLPEAEAERLQQQVQSLYLEAWKAEENSKQRKSARRSMGLAVLLEEYEPGFLSKIPPRPQRRAVS